MHVFVINLEKDRERRDSIGTQFSSLDLAFEFVPGTLGSALSPEELAVCYDDKKARRNLCMSLVPAHLGCSLSHTRVYREIIQRNLPCALILEDDVVLPASLPNILSRIEGLLDSRKPEAILLSPAEGINDPRRTKDLGNGSRIIPFRSGFFTSSYIVTHTAARSLLKELYPVGDVADCWLRLKRYKVVDIFALSPPLIKQNREAFGSSTHEDMIAVLVAMRMKGLRKLVFKTRRAWSRLLDIFYAAYRRNFVPYAGILKNRDVHSIAGPEGSTER